MGCHLWGCTESDTTEATAAAAAAPAITRPPISSILIPPYPLVNQKRPSEKEEAKILVRTVFEVREGDEPMPSKVEQAPDVDDSKKVKVNLSSLMGRNTPAPAPVAVERKTVTEKKTVLQDLYLKVPSENSREMEMVQSVLEIFNYGKQDVYIYFDDTKKLVRALDTHSFVTPTMMETLSRRLGEGSVKLKDKK